jgi:hypothetical protein
MKEAKIKLGLVLAGGGAKGAYQSGQYLHFSQEDASLCDPNPLDKFLRYAINPQQLRAGIELWVAAFPSAHNFLPSSHKAGQIVPTIGNAIAPRKFCAASGNIKAIKRRFTNLLVKTE